MGYLELSLLKVDLDSTRMLLLAIGMMVAGGLALLAAVYRKRRRIALRRRIVATEGTVLSSEHDALVINDDNYRTGRQRDIVTYYTNITARYRTAGGEAHEITRTVPIPAGGRDYFHGDTIAVFYDSTDPKNATLAAPPSEGNDGLMYGVALAVLLFGVGCALIGLRSH